MSTIEQKLGLIEDKIDGLLEMTQKKISDNENTVEIILCCEKNFILIN